MDVETLVAPAWLGFKPYEPGKSIESLAAQAGMDPADICKLASNENPLPLSENIRTAFMDSFHGLARYPDGGGAPLKAALSKYLAVDQSQLVLGTGSNGILDGLARVFLQPEQSAMFCQYSFMVYRLAVQARGAKAIVIPAKNWGHDIEAFTTRYQQLYHLGQAPRLVYLANPNNPTGTWFSQQVLESFLKAVDPEQTIVVLDEAYAEYCLMPDYPDSLSLLDRYPNLIVTRTFSKAWGLAGLRVGYAIGQPELIRWLEVERAPFNVAGPGLRVAAVALEDQAFLQASISHNSKHLDLLQRWLDEQKISYIPSVANFVTIEFPNLNAQDIFEKLLSRGVITRPLAGYAMPHCLRVSVGLAQENTRFCDALLWALDRC